MTQGYIKILQVVTNNDGNQEGTCAVELRACSDSGGDDGKGTAQWQ